MLLRASLASLLVLMASAPALAAPITDLASAGGVTGSLATGPDRNYTAGGITFNFQTGTNATTSPDNRTLSQFTANAQTYSFVFQPEDPLLLIRRINNVAHTGTPQLLWYETDSTPGSTRNVRPTRVNDMVGALLSLVINRGTDNVFQNTGTNSNNVERLDFVYARGINIHTTKGLNDAGFPVLERNGNDDYGIAAITAIDGSGNPTAYAALDLRGANEGGTWGTSNNLSFATTIQNSENAGSSGIDYALGGDSGVQTIAGDLVSLSDLGLSVGQTFYGYSLFAGDMSTSDTSAQLVALQDTGSGGVYSTSTTGADGGMDLVGGGFVFGDNITSADITINPEPSGIALFGLGLGLVAARRRRGSRRRARSAPDRIA